MSIGYLIIIAVSILLGFISMLSASHNIAVYCYLTHTKRLLIFTLSGIHTSMPFSDVEVYLIVACILNIKLFGFSLGVAILHSISFMLLNINSLGMYLEVVTRPPPSLRVCF